MCHFRILQWACNEYILQDCNEPICCWSTGEVRTFCRWELSKETNLTFSKEINGGCYIYIHIKNNTAHKRKGEEKYIYVLSCRGLVVGLKLSSRVCHSTKSTRSGRLNMSSTYRMLKQEKSGCLPCIVPNRMPPSPKVGYSPQAKCHISIFGRCINMIISSYFRE